MKDNFNKESALYKSLGKLFYAIASADGVARNEEFLKLKQEIENNWKLFTDANESIIESIINTFQELQNLNEIADSCFDEFVSFKKANESLFNDEMKRLILITANKIAYSFSKKNKSELILLAKLEIAFRN